MGPSRPMNMSAVSRSCPAVPTCAVIPVDSPTVEKAEITSNRTWSRVNGVSISIRMVEPTTVATDRSATLSAWRWGPRGMCRKNAVTLVSPRTSVRMTNSSTAKVVTLMPPAVPAGPPPMNMSTFVPSSVSVLSAPGSMLLKPAVRV